MRKMQREVRGAPVLWAGWLENEMPEVRRAKPAQANNRLFHLGLGQFDRKRAGLLRAEEGRLRLNRAASLRSQGCRNGDFKAAVGKFRQQA